MTEPTIFEVELVFHGQIGFYRLAMEGRDLASQEVADCPDCLHRATTIDHDTGDQHDITDAILDAAEEYLQDSEDQSRHDAGTLRIQRP